MCFSPAVTHSQMSSVTVYHDVFSRSVCGLFLKHERETMWSGESLVHDGILEDCGQGQY